MSDDKVECSAYRADAGVCANGFFQTRGCWSDIRCLCCGAPPAPRYLPHCLKDELPEHWINDDGTPAFLLAQEAGDE
jgi:hypothetical protein